MRCAFESRQEQLTIYPFPGLKVINIRGSNLLALDLITIGSFVSRLSDNNRLLELSMRDYPLDETGLRGLLPCLPLVRTVTLCARRLHDPSSYKMIGMYQKNITHWDLMRKTCKLTFEAKLHKLDFILNFLEKVLTHHTFEVRRPFCIHSINQMDSDTFFWPHWSG